ncbi:MAG: hypothetical protein ACFFG0_50275 [Candidatus Thorarchaeota archaeon]
MVQVYIKKEELEEPLIIEDVIILEELPAIKEDYAIMPVKAEEKQIKKSLLKLLKKAKYNPKYLEETIPVEKFRRNIHFRNYPIY